MLRAKAASAGNLKSTPQQVVSTREEGGHRTIYIAPANPERVYVPANDSSTVFTDFAAGAMLFGTGVLVGAAWNVLSSLALKLQARVVNQQHHPGRQLKLNLRG